MAAPCKSVPPGPTCESNGLSENGPIPKKDIAKPTKKNKPLRPTITAIRIPADGTLPYLIVLELVKASSDYHFNLYDSTLVHHSKTRCMRDPGCRCIQFHNPLADHAELGENPLYDSGASVYDKATCSGEELECYYSPNAFSYGNGYGTLLDVPLDLHARHFTPPAKCRRSLLEIWRSLEATCLSTTTCKPTRGSRLGDDDWRIPHHVHS